MNTKPAAEARHAIILFDGVCNLCCASVQFIIAHDPKGYFTFASQQSSLGKALLSAAGLPATMDTFVLIENGVTYTRPQSLPLVRPKGNMLGPHAGDQEAIH